MNRLHFMYGWRRGCKMKIIIANSSLIPFTSKSPKQIKSQIISGDWKKARRFLRFENWPRN